MNSKYSIFLILAVTLLSCYTVQGAVECSSIGNPNDFCDDGFICCGEGSCCLGSTL
jgi:hypothetical protein